MTTIMLITIDYDDGKDDDDDDGDNPGDTHH